MRFHREGMYSKKTVKPTLKPSTTPKLRSNWERRRLSENCAKRWVGKDKENDAKRAESCKKVGMAICPK